MRTKIDWARSVPFVLLDSDEDIHSPSQGFWRSHMLWILVNDYDETDFSRIRDLSQFPELRWLNHYHWVPGLAYGAGFLIFGGPVVFLWGFVVSTVLLWHGTFAINSLAHVFGSVRYNTDDQSKNNFWLALLTMGEGWHNNHHFYMNSARQGFFWWEIDFTFYLLKSLERTGIVSDVRVPPLSLIRRAHRLQFSLHGKR
jgi:stearoyl-CoA desaturase (delta-9 desaturase)